MEENILHGTRTKEGIELTLQEDEENDANMEPRVKDEDFDEGTKNRYCLCE